MSFGLNQQVLWYRCRGLDNSPWAAVSLACVHVLVGSNKFYGAVAGDRKNFTKSIFRQKKELLIWTFKRKRTKTAFQVVAIFSH